MDDTSDEMLTPLAIPEPGPPVDLTGNPMRQSAPHTGNWGGLGGTEGSRHLRMPGVQPKGPRLTPPSMDGAGARPSGSVPPPQQLVARPALWEPMLPASYGAGASPSGGTLRLRLPGERPLDMSMQVSLLQQRTPEAS